MEKYDATTYLIMSESATTVYHRLNHVRQLDRSDQILCTEVKLRNNIEIYWLLQYRTRIASNTIDAYF